MKTLMICGLLTVSGLCLGSTRRTPQKERTPQEEKKIMDTHPVACAASVIARQKGEAVIARLHGSKLNKTPQDPHKLGVPQSRQQSQQQPSPSKIEFPTLKFRSTRSSQSSDQTPESTVIFTIQLPLL